MDRRRFLYHVMAGMAGTTTAIALTEASFGTDAEDSSNLKAGSLSSLRRVSRFPLVHLITQSRTIVSGSSSRQHTLN
jgi:hypothetical protein